MDPNTPTPHLVRVRIGLTQEDATRLASALTAAGYPAEVEYLDGSGDYTVRVVNTHAAHGATWAAGYLAGFLAGNEGHDELLAALEDMVAAVGDDTEIAEERKEKAWAAIAKASPQAL